MTEEKKLELEKQAMALGKRESKTVVIDGKKYFLCGTCLVYEDELCDKVRECFDLLAEIFEVELSEEERCDYLEDYVSEVRDEVFDRFEKLTNGEIIFGSTQY